MGPRKQSRPNPKVEEPFQIAQDAHGTTTTRPDVNSDNDGLAFNTGGLLLDLSLKHVNPTESDIASLKSRSSRGWYAGGTWPKVRKASPSTQIARETILADKPKNAASPADFSRFESRKADAEPPPSGAPLPSSHLHSHSKQTLRPALGDVTIKEGEARLGDTCSHKPSKVLNPPGKVPISDAIDHEPKPVMVSGWLDWFRTSNLGQQEEHHEHLPASAPHDDATADVIKPAKVPTELLSLENASLSNRESNASSISNKDGQSNLPISTSSWFNIWPTSVSNGPTSQSVGGSQGDLQKESETHIASITEAPIRDESTAPSAGSTWAFWSKDQGRFTAKESKFEETGELAVTGEPSQNSPTPAHAKPPLEVKVDTIKNTKRGRQLPDEPQESAQKDMHKAIPRQKTASQAVSNLPSDSPQKPTPSQSPVPSKVLPPNILLPSFRGTYQLMENPSVIQQITRLLMHNQRFPSNHVYIIKDPPKVKKALAIGIHGLFPAPLLRTVIGQPTGTSIRFANHAAAAIHRWTSTQGCDCEVEKIALEGEGKIAERVDNLWKLLLNWIDHVRNADFILIACHSQGVPVALMLVAKLIEFGAVVSAKIGVCAMAGVSLGPFADYNSRLFSGSAAELFDFANTESDVSRRYESSMRVALRYGVRISYIGSIDDQLVSLESAIFSPASHPYIYRAVFVDGRVHAPDFIAHLVGLTLKLRNLGVSDHGLIRELSVPLAGSLYTGEGHSRLYDEIAVYDAAIAFALETTSVGDAPLQIQKYEIPTNSNPFQLPWSMRGLLEEDLIKTELDQETKDLLKQFEEWKPTSKVLKDVKYRLEAVKSKL